MRWKFGDGGRYAPQAEKLRDQLRADLVLVFVLGGKKGSGLSITQRGGGGLPLNPSQQLDVLRQAIEQIERGVSGFELAIEPKPPVAKGQA